MLYHQVYKAYIRCASIQQPWICVLPSVWLCLMRLTLYRDSQKSVGKWERTVFAVDREQEVNSSYPGFQVFFLETAHFLICSSLHFNLLIFFQVGRKIDADKSNMIQVNGFLISLCTCYAWFLFPMFSHWEELKKPQFLWPS